MTDALENDKQKTYICVRCSLVGPESLIVTGSGDWGKSVHIINRDKLGSVT